MITIDRPGVYEGVPEDQYHADRGLAAELGRSLSQSGAKTLLESPERFAWERDHGRPPKDAFDLGSLAHALILRSGDNRICVIDAYDWRTKAAQEARKAAYAAGLIPVHRADLLQASRIAAAVRRHPLAGSIFAKGRPEVTLYWVDEETGITCRARVDWVRDNALVDLKTTRYGGSTPPAFGKSAASYDYPMQAAHYSDGYEALTGEALPFVTVVVEVDPPYLISVGQYTAEDVETGRERMRRAKATFAERESSGAWADAPQIVTFPIPGWYASRAALEAS